MVARFGGLEAVVTTAIDLGVERETLAAAAAEALEVSDAAAHVAREAADRARAADALLIERAPRRSGLDADLLGRISSSVGTLVAQLERATAIGERLETPVRARADAGAQRASELGAELRRLGAEEVGLRARAEDAAERATAIEVDLARLEADAEEARRRLVEAAGLDRGGRQSSTRTTRP